MFDWYDYLPMQYEKLIVGIDYTNYCFSLIEPWPLEPIPSAAIAQLILADILAIAAIIVSISFLREMLKKQKC